MLLALATSKGALRRKVCGIWAVSVAFFRSPMDEFTVVRPPPGLRVKGKLWVLNRALHGTRMASRCFGKLVAEVLKNTHFETVSIVLNTYHHPQRYIDSVVHGDDFVAVAEDGSWITSSKFSRIPWRSSESGVSDPVAQPLENCSSVSSTGAATGSLGRRIQG